MKKIYILLSYSGSFPARLIKTFTGKKYTHSSISLNKELSPLYSFGRKKPNNFLVGGFIEERIGEGIFKKFPETCGEVLELEISDESFFEINKTVSDYLGEKNRYKYSFFRAFLCYFGIENRNPYKSYCSDFVSKVLKSGGIDLSALPKSPKPCDFPNLKGAVVIYCGKINDYNAN